MYNTSEMAPLQKDVVATKQVGNFSVAGDDDSSANLSSNNHDDLMVGKEDQSEGSTDRPAVSNGNNEMASSSTSSSSSSSSLTSSSHEASCSKDVRVKNSLEESKGQVKQPRSDESQPAAHSDGTALLNVRGEKEANVVINELTCVLGMNPETCINEAAPIKIEVSESCASPRNDENETTKTKTERSDENGSTEQLSPSKMIKETNELESPKVKRWKQRIQARRSSRSSSGKSAAKEVNDVQAGDVLLLPDLDLSARNSKKKKSSLKGKKWHERLDRRRRNSTLTTDDKQITAKTEESPESAKSEAKMISNETQPSCGNDKEGTEIKVLEPDHAIDNTESNNVRSTKNDDAFQNELRTSFLAFDALLDNTTTAVASETTMMKDDDSVYTEVTNDMTAITFDEEQQQQKSGRSISKKLPNSSSHSVATQVSRSSQSSDVSERSKQRIVELLRKDIWSRDTNVVHHALLELGKEAGVGDANRANIVRCGGVLAIMKAMDVNSTHEDIHVAACDALSNLALNIDAQAAICEVGGLSSIVGVMKDHTDNVELQASACAALASITRPRRSQRDMSTSDLILMTTYTTTATATEDDDDAVQVLMVAMKKYEDHPKIQAKSFGALANLCLQNQDRLLEFSKAGGIIAMTKALHQPWESIQEQHEAISSLSILLRCLVDRQKSEEEDDEDASLLEGAGVIPRQLSTDSDDNGISQSPFPSVVESSTNKNTTKTQHGPKWVTASDDTTGKDNPFQKKTGVEEKGECVIQ